MTTINNEVQKPDDATLIIKRMLNAPPELAFKAWTTPEHIQQWMRPEPDLVVPFATMDLRVGGKFRIQMKKPDGEYFTAAGVFKEVKAPERLVYTWDWEKDGSGTEFGEVEWLKDYVAHHGGIFQAGRANGIRDDAQPVRHGGDPGQSRARLEPGRGKLCEFCGEKMTRRISAPDFFSHRCPKDDGTFVVILKLN